MDARKACTAFIRTFEASDFSAVAYEMASPQSALMP